MRFYKFFKNLQKDGKTYLFFLGVLCLYRIYFIYYMRDFMAGDTGAGDIALALWTGFRISLKSAGIIVLPMFLLATVVNVFFPKWDMDRVRNFFAGTALLFLSVLFQARFPYYREFRMTFNQQIMHGLQDDLYALFITMIEQYNLPLRFLLALGLTLLFYKLFKRLVIKTKLLDFPEMAHPAGKYLLEGSIIFLLPMFMLFMRFGGSFNYTNSINWENAGITKDGFLNEAILDDFQAVYRGYSSSKRMAAGDLSGIDKQKIQEYSHKIAGHTDLTSDELAPYLQRTAQGERLKKPRHIFIVLGESWAQWPMLEKYKDLHVADGIKGLIAEDQAFYTRAFMPNGDFTSTAITGMVTGLSDVNIYVNYQPRTFKEIYPTAMAPQFHRLGYKVDFWYAGFPSWDRVKDFTLAQGFDRFFGCADYDAPKQNIWGTKDEYLFAALSDHLSQEEPTVHLIMTSSNHPPYNLDLAREGFDVDKELAALPAEAVEREELVKELGHYWYMDKIVTAFVRRTMEQYPDSLFIITGDHAERMNLSGTPSMFEKHSIPLLVYGQGVTKNLLPTDVAGGHTNLVPTLIELIAPAGFEYYSIADSMTEHTEVGFNRNNWITKNGMGEMDSAQQEFLPGVSGVDLNQDRQKVKEKAAMMRTISWWLLQKGTSMTGDR